MWSFREVDRDGDLVYLLAESPVGTVEVLAEMRREGDTLTLAGFGVQRAGPNTLGRRGLLELAHDMMRWYGVTTLIIQGGPRGSGMGPPGRIPRPLMFRLP